MYQKENSLFVDFLQGWASFLAMMGRFFLEREQGAQHGRAYGQSSKKDRQREGKDRLRVSKEDRKEPEHYGKQPAAEQAAEQTRALVPSGGEPSACRGGKVQGDQAYGKGERGGILRQQAERRSKQTEDDGNGNGSPRPHGGVLQ